MVLRIERLDGRRHRRGDFDSGVPILDAYLRERASQHQRDGIATTHILTEALDPGRILGWYSLAAAQVKLADLSESDRARLPRHPVPAARLARLAVDRREQGRGLGAALLQDAVKRCLDLRGDLGLRVLIVDAKDERAAAFYRAFGFTATADVALTLYLPLGNP
jgi:GNAT superfamily N-acetyltransferase